MILAAAVFDDKSLKYVFNIFLKYLILPRGALGLRQTGNFHDRRQIFTMREIASNAIDIQPTGGS